ncbi:MAG: hypothetical protein KAS47_01145, partial [Candidatus Heimdallarchaeota archaeon]|nr:hypothetical protein [Candidatus Heimdallarchaeota archaeon]
FVVSQVISPSVYDANKKAAENMRKVSEAAQVKIDLKKTEEDLRDVKSSIEETKVEFARARSERDSISSIDKDRDRKVMLAEQKIVGIQDKQLKLEKERIVHEDTKRKLQEESKKAKKIEDAFKSKGDAKKSDGKKKKEYYCEKCDYKCSTKFLFTQHCSTKKHQNQEMLISLRYIYSLTHVLQETPHRSPRKTFCKVCLLLLL